MAGVPANEIHQSQRYGNTAQDLLAEANQDQAKRASVYQLAP